MTWTCIGRAAIRAACTPAKWISVSRRRRPCSQPIASSTAYRAKPPPFTGGPMVAVSRRELRPWIICKFGSWRDSRTYQRTLTARLLTAADPRWCHDDVGIPIGPAWIRVRGIAELEGRNRVLRVRPACRIDDLVVVCIDLHVAVRAVDEHFHAVPVAGLQHRPHRRSSRQSHRKDRVVFVEEHLAELLCHFHGCGALVVVWIRHRLSYRIVTHPTEVLVRPVEESRPKRRTGHSHRKHAKSRAPSSRQHFQRLNTSMMDSLVQRHQVAEHAAVRSDRCAGRGPARLFEVRAESRTGRTIGGAAAPAPSPCG